MEVLVETLTGVDAPYMRDQVLSAVEALSDPDYQRRVWIDREMPTPKYYDDFDMNIHILFDDTLVCEDPDGSVPGILFASEVEPFRALGRALYDIMDIPELDLDVDYLNHSSWANIVDLARVAWAAMKVNGDGIGSRNVIWSDSE